MYSHNTGEHFISQLFTTRSYIIDIKKIEEIYMLDVKDWVEKESPYIPHKALVHDHHQFKETVHAFLEYFLYRQSNWNKPSEPIPEDYMDLIHPWVTDNRNIRKRLGLSNAIFRLYQYIEALMPPEIEVRHWGVWSHHSIGKTRLVFTLEGDYRLMQMALRNNDATQSENVHI